MSADKSFEEIEQENYDKMLDAFVTYNQSKDDALKEATNEEIKIYKAELADNLEKLSAAETQEEMEQIIEENAGDEAFQAAMSAMEIMKPEEYVVRGALLCCSGGSHRRRLNLPECHGVYIGCNPIMHSGDCVTGIEGSEINITSFGVCKGTSNGGLNEGDTSLATEVVDEQGLPIVGETDGGVIRGKRCKAMIANGKWENVHTSTIVGDTGESAITVNSFLVCAHGGVITVLTSGQEHVMTEDDIENLEIAAFEEDMMEQFNVDEKTANLMGDVYRGLEQDYLNATQEELDWMFTRLIGGFSYGDEFNWNQTAGNILGSSSEEEYFTKKLGFTQEDYNYLRYKVRVQNYISALEDKQYIVDGEGNQIENYDSFKSNFELGHNLKLTDEEFNKLWNEQMNQLHGYGDLSHQFVTMASICATKVNKDGILANLYTGGDERRENFAGWLGDATLGDKPSLGADDYIADLDAENITHMMQEEGLSFMQASNQYYSEVGKEYTRAEKFLENTELSYVIDQISIELGYSYTYNVDGLYPKIELYTDEEKIELIKKSSPDAYRFIKNLQNNNNALQPMEE